MKNKVIRDFNIRFLLLTMPALLILGCVEDDISGGSLTTDLPLEIPPEEDISFLRHVLPVFVRNCAPCHIGNRESGVRLDSHEQVMESEGAQYGTHIVVPEEPENSPLMDKIDPGSGEPEHGDPMPQGSAIGNVFIEGIRTWIEEGARNN